MRLRSIFQRVFLFALLSVVVFCLSLLTRAHPPPTTRTVDQSGPFVYKAVLAAKLGSRPPSADMFLMICRALGSWGNRFLFRDYAQRNAPEDLDPTFAELIRETLTPDAWSDEPPEFESRFSTGPRGGLKRRIVVRGNLPGPVTLQGSWNARGRLAGAGGWARIPLVKSGGQWATSVLLEPTKRAQAYRCVVSDKDGPRGAFHFEISSRCVEIEMMVGAKGAARPAVTVKPVPASRGKLLLIGINGATWLRLMPLVHAGQLPNFSRWMREGGWGILESLVFAPGKTEWSPALMTSAVTGKVVSEHGISGRWYASGFDLRAAPLWRIAAKQGLKTDFIGWYGGWPIDTSVRRAVTDTYFCDALYVAFGGNIPEISDTRSVLPKTIRSNEQALIEIFSVVSGVRSSWTIRPSKLAKDVSLPSPPVDLTDMHYISSVLGYVDQSTFIFADRFSRDPSDLLCMHLRGLEGLGDEEPSAVSKPNLSKVRADLETFNDSVSVYLKNIDARIADVAAAYETTLIFSDHVPDGLVLFFGKDVRNGVRLKNASLLDITPTALALLGLPRADDMDGEVLVDAFVPGSPVARPSVPVPTYGGSGSAWMRLIASILF